MDGIPDHILSLSDHDLKIKLIENGFTAPILSPVVRKICQRKLAKKLGVFCEKGEDEGNIPARTYVTGEYLYCRFCFYA